MTNSLLNGSPLPGGQSAGGATASGGPSSRPAERLAELEALLPQGHLTRRVFDLVSAKGSAARISAVSGGAKGAVSYFTLWLLANLRGTGSAEDLAWLCQNNVGFRWLNVGLPGDAKSFLAYRKIESAAVDTLLAEYLTILLVPRGAGPIGEPQWLTSFNEAQRRVAMLRMRLADPLDKDFVRRNGLTEERRKNRAAWVEASLLDHGRLSASLAAESKRLAEEKRLAELQKTSTVKGAETPRRDATPRRFVATTSLAWSAADGSESRFKRVLIGALLIFLVMSVALLSIKPPPVERAQVTKVPERLTKLFEEQKVKAKVELPKPQEALKAKEVEAKDPLKPSDALPDPAVVAKADPKTVAQTDPNKASKATAEQVAAARERASQSGLVAMKDQLAALRQLGGGDAFKQDQVSVGAGGHGGGSGSAIGGGAGTGSGAGSGGDLIGRAATAGSGGVAGTAVAYSGGGSLGGRSTTRVSGPTGVPSLAQVEKEAKGGKRSAEDIKVAFDANKSAIYGIYRRALRNNPSLEGRVVLKLTIDKSGKVTACTIASSALKDPELEEKLVMRVMLIDFGARPTSEIWSGTYQIDFVPSS